MALTRNRVIALGFFDGIHLGHQALLRRCVELAGALDAQPALLSFDRSPREFVSGTPVPLLTTNQERRRIAASLFPDLLYITLPFDKFLMTMPWENFVELMKNSYQAVWLVAGHDFRFGYKNIGNGELLQSKTAELNMGCDIIPAVKINGVTVSSTAIRALLEKGDVKSAALFLGRPFAISGTVRHGKRLGSSKLNAPTVNLVPEPNQLVPAFGVYATRVYTDGKSWPAVTNVGVRPTVDTDGGVTVESHLLDLAENLYGAVCCVEFLKMLRPERKFDCLDDLRIQIARDAQDARCFFDKSSE